MTNDIEKLITEIEYTEEKLRLEAPKNIGKNLSRYLKLKEKLSNLK